MEISNHMALSTTNPLSVNNTRSTELISSETRQILEVINSVILICIGGVLGITSNILNMVIFYKQGLDNTMNISLFALAISDFGSLITLVWSAICINPLFINSGLPLDTTQIQYLTGAWPHVCLARITCWITAYITGERCLCIALPLKVKQILTPRRTTMIICLMYLINIISFVPEFSSVYLAWKYFPNKNRTLLSLGFTENRKNMEGISFILLAVLGMIPFPAVIVFTLILVWRLKAVRRWRKTSTRDGQQSAATSKRDVRTMNMVLLIAVVLIVCYTPSVVVSIATFIEPEFSIDGRYVNVWFISFGLAFLFECINSSINIFLYYTMSSNFKNTFHEIFRYSDETDILSPPRVTAEKVTQF